MFRNELKQIEVANYLGVSRGFISQVVAGTRPVPENMLNKLINNNKGWDTSLLTEPKKENAATSEYDGLRFASIDELIELIKKRDELVSKILDQNRMLIEMLSKNSSL